MQYHVIQYCVIVSCHAVTHCSVEQVIGPQQIDFVPISAEIRSQSTVQDPITDTNIPLAHHHHLHHHQLQFLINMMIIVIIIVI